VVSGETVTGCENTCSRLLYDLRSDNGAGAVMTSMAKNLPIRVFRSSKLQGPLQAEEVLHDGELKPGYRYDGLHKVVSWEQKGDYIRFCLEPTAPSTTFSEEVTVNHSGTTDLTI